MNIKTLTIFIILFGMFQTIHAQNEELSSTLKLVLEDAKTSFDAIEKKDQKYFTPEKYDLEGCVDYLKFNKSNATWYYSYYRKMIYSEKKFLKDFDEMLTAIENALPKDYGVLETDLSVFTANQMGRYDQKMDESLKVLVYHHPDEKSLARNLYPVLYFSLSQDKKERYRFQIFVEGPARVVSRTYKVYTKYDGKIFTMFNDKIVLSSLGEFHYYNSDNELETYFPEYFMYKFTDPGVWNITIGNYVFVDEKNRELDMKFSYWDYSKAKKEDREAMGAEDADFEFLIDGEKLYGYLDEVVIEEEVFVESVENEKISSKNYNGYYYDRQVGEIDKSVLFTLRLYENNRFVLREKENGVWNDLYDDTLILIDQYTNTEAEDVTVYEFSTPVKDIKEIKWVESKSLADALKGLDLKFIMVLHNGIELELHMSLVK